MTTRSRTRACSPSIRRSRVGNGMGKRRSGPNAGALCVAGVRPLAWPPPHFVFRVVSCALCSRAGQKGLLSRVEALLPCTCSFCRKKKKGNGASVMSLFPPPFLCVWSFARVVDAVSRTRGDVCCTDVHVALFFFVATPTALRWRVAVALSKKRTRFCDSTRCSQCVHPIAKKWRISA